MNKLTAPVEKLGQDAVGYVDSRVDDIKLQVAKGLSQGTGSMAGFVLILVVVGNLLLVLSLAGVLLLGEVLDSYAKAAFIVAGALILILVVLLLCRDRLFRNSFVGLFTGILAPEDAQADPIRTQKQLDAALARSKNRIQKKKDGIQARLVDMRSFYSPKNLVTTSVRKDILPLLIRLVGRRRKRK